MHGTFKIVSADEIIELAKVQENDRGMIPKKWHLIPFQRRFTHQIKVRLAIVLLLAVVAASETSIPSSSHEETNKGQKQRLKIIPF